MSFKAMYITELCIVKGIFLRIPRKTIHLKNRHHSYEYVTPGQELSTIYHFNKKVKQALPGICRVLPRFAKQCHQSNSQRPLILSHHSSLKQVILAICDGTHVITPQFACVVSLGFSKPGRDKRDISIREGTKSGRA